METIILITLGTLVVISTTLSLLAYKDQEKRCNKKIDKEKKIANAQIEEYRQKVFCLYDKLKKQKKEIASLEESLEIEKRNSCIDSLTGIYDRGYLDKNAQQIIDLADRSEQAVHFLLLDLDNFKQINDTLGHSAGDDILRKVADKIRSVARHTDTYVRLGGDEFFLILPGTDSNGAKLLSQRLEREISKIPKELGITCSGFGASIGAINHKTGDSFEKSMKNADGMMYRVKERRKKR